MQQKHKKSVCRAVNRLEKTFGEPVWQGRSNPLDSLIKTVLSQNTNDRNRDRAYDQLCKRFPTWEQVMQADVREIAAAIRSAGLSNQKSLRMKNILSWIQERYGSLNLDFMCEADPRETVRTFIQLKGIGIKTISVVLMFSCGIDIFPVDTHVHRICMRLGWVPQGVSAEKTHELMQPLVPKGKAYSLHMNLLRLGRTVCKARTPKCPGCPLRRDCEYYTEIISAGKE
jgi:endonuclease III